LYYQGIHWQYRLLVDKSYHFNILDNEKSGLCTKRDEKVLWCDLIVILGQYPSL